MSDTLTLQIAVVVASLLLFALAVWIGGSIAVNRGWQQAREGIEIRVWSNGLHVDFVLPIATRHVDWRAFAPLQNPSGPNEWQGYINLGWGDHDFYVLTPTEADFSYAVAASPCSPARVAWAARSTSACRASVASLAPNSSSRSR